MNYLGLASALEESNYLKFPSMAIDAARAIRLLTAERDAFKSKIDRLKYIMASNAYKDGGTLSVEICVLGDEAVGDFSERIYWFVDRAME